MNPRRVFVIVCCLVFVVVLPAGVWAAGPAVVNGGFDNGPLTPSWTKHETAGGNGGLSTPSGSDRGLSFYCVTSDSTCDPYSQKIDVSDYKGQTLIVSGWLLKTCVPTKAALGKIQAFVIDASDDCPMPTESYPVVHTGDDVTPSNEWIQGSVKVQIPAGGVDAEYALCIYLVGEGNELYYDDITVTPEEATAVTLGGTSAVSQMLGLPAVAAVGVATSIWLAIRKRTLPTP